MFFNEYINQRRKDLNMSVDELVLKSGIPKGTLSKITAGINTNPTLSTIEAICSALNCSIDDAVNGAKKSTAPTNSSKIDAQKSKLISNYDKLNDEGQNKLVGYSEDLVDTKKYVKSNTDSIKIDA